MVSGRDPADQKVGAKIGIHNQQREKLNLPEAKTPSAKDHVEETGLSFFRIT
jgi:hypothetical protein